MQEHKTRAATIGFFRKKVTVQQMNDQAIEQKKATGGLMFFIVNAAGQLKPEW